MTSVPTTPTTPLTPGGFNTKSPTIKRILQESRELATIPDPFLTAAPLETNLFEWHFTITGAPGTPYEKGIYHGRIVLPTSYPLRPPSFRFLTPSGRFEVNREICLSISGHHEETWQPAWGIRTALCAIRAFMEGGSKGQVGGMDTSDEVRQRMALQSRTWTCPTCGGGTNEDIMKECETKWAEENEGKEKPSAEIPQELRMAYKDDLERGPPTPMPNQQKHSETTEQHSEPAASQPRTPVTPAPLIAVNERVSQLRSRAAPPLSPLRTSMTPDTAHASSTQSPNGSVASPAPVTARSDVASPQTAMSYTPTPTIARPPPPRTTTVTPNDREGVPIWLDRTIQGVVIALVVMLLRQFMTGSSHFDDYD